ncbi:motility associated factor glycosyltransferase family protein [Candidatus Protochlamydia sp. R18]|uniref:motility associated factor glycosyltransferase family protein n=1 Tax=Candidatus Protochlamydia sp. R18 TaxID=1353977 RepID=UPI0005A69DC4|nr:6-hydroxymethylpterin diphosphokinase MptE-like protein [Candidatus Protochlamydia sp. R18]
MNDKRFEDNLEQLQKKDAKLAYQLLTAQADDLLFVKTNQNENNLKRIYEGTTYFYHSSQSAQIEAKNWFDHLSPQHISILFVYGIGLGYYYLAALDWLKQDERRRLVFLEEDLGVLCRLFETEMGTKLLSDAQVQIVYLENGFEDKTLLNELSWKYLNDTFAISALKLYLEVNAEGFSKLKHLLSYHLNQKKAFVEEYLQYGIAFFRNFYPNLLMLPKSYFGNALFGQFKHTPAIICGAGPSLNKNLEQLKNLKDRALIFAGSSALNALIPEGIIPHFGVAVDPNQAQLPRVAAAKPHQIPFFYRQRLFHKALEVISGPKLYLSGTGGYDISKWFEEQLNLKGEELDEGHNVVNLSLEIAHALGCNPIILVGVDLAFTDETYYAKGVIEDLKLTDDDFKTANDFESELLLREDIHGKPTRTLWKWISESEWITEFAEKHPELTLINATEGGIGFKNILNKTLLEVTEKFLNQPQFIDEKVAIEVVKNPLSSITQNQILELLKVLQASLDRCISLFTQLIETSSHLLKQIENGFSSPEIIQTPKTSLLETDIEEEISYQYLLDTFNQVYLRVHHRTILELQEQKKDSNIKEQSLQKISLQINRLTFLQNVARVNRELIQRSISEFLASSQIL